MARSSPLLAELEFVLRKGEMNLGALEHMLLELKKHNNDLARRAFDPRPRPFFKVRSTTVLAESYRMAGQSSSSGQAQILLSFDDDAVRLALDECKEARAMVTEYRPNATTPDVAHRGHILRLIERHQALQKQLKALSESSAWAGYDVKQMSDEIWLAACAADALLRLMSRTPDNTSPGAWLQQHLVRDLFNIQAWEAELSELQDAARLATAIARRIEAPEGYLDRVAPLTTAVEPATALGTRSGPIDGRIEQPARPANATDFAALQSRRRVLFRPSKWGKWNPSNATPR